MVGGHAGADASVALEPGMSFPPPLLMQALGFKNRWPIT